jgi:AbrB family looped-hinge helix DNA binding protein
MRQFTSRATSKGQVTVPVEIRRHLGIEPGDRVTFILADDGTVQVQRAMYPTLESLRGAAGTLPRPMEWRELLDIAREDRFRERYGEQYGSTE